MNEVFADLDELLRDIIRDSPTHYSLNDLLGIACSDNEIIDLIDDARKRYRFDIEGSYIHERLRTLNANPKDSQGVRERTGFRLPGNVQYTYVRTEELTHGESTYVESTRQYEIKKDRESLRKFRAKMEGLNGAA